VYNYLAKHLIFIALVFAALFGLYFVTNDVDLNRFGNLTTSFLGVLTTFILISSILLSKGSTVSTNILMGGIVFKMLISLSFFVIYAIVVKILNVPIVIMFMMQYFLFTGWLLYLLLQFFNSKDNDESGTT